MVMIPWYLVVFTKAFVHNIQMVSVSWLVK